MINLIMDVTNCLFVFKFESCLFLTIELYAISKTLLYQCKDPQKPRILLFGPTLISAVNIGNH